MGVAMENEKIKCPGCGLELKPGTAKCPRCGRIISCGTCCTDNCLKCGLNRRGK